MRPSGGVPAVPARAGVPAAGNTDAHLKNVAMFHTADGLRLAPNCDMVASAYDRQFQTRPLTIAGTDTALGISNRSPVDLGRAYELPDAATRLAVDGIGRRLPQGGGRGERNGDRPSRYARLRQ